MLKKLLEANTGGGRRRVPQVFADFCELTAITFRNAVDLHRHDARESRHAEILASYSDDEVARFPQMIAELILEFEKGFGDHLGHLYMSLDLGNESLGQYFTPYSVSSLLAKMTIGEQTTALDNQPFITLHEPSCGSGGMIVAFAEAMDSVGLNYQRRVHVTAVDLDQTAVHMTYVALTLLHMPAVVVHGNTLTLEEFDVWPTPAHVLGSWETKLRTHRSTQRAGETPTSAASSAAEAPPAPMTDDPDRSAA
ncbi:N-6 DNA Methylase [Plantibacter flavus]|uniref:N-6 DNA methylase n=1 Tax=Plantibacter flavus TaxID=150123 RepID=A0A3N2BL42_9MICO|nr:N-6 DNA methylase [Plantibacter flavus]ROR76003.1 N-6 DNA methylase [Plantibacter flavus]SMG49479.1 N-6 DNA Methylase [Plantibacter flavus]